MTDKYWLEALAVFLDDSLENIQNHLGDIDFVKQYKAIALGSEVLKPKISALQPPFYQEQSFLFFLNTLRSEIVRENKIAFYHPLSGNKSELDLGKLDDIYVKKVTQEILKDQNDPKKIYFLLWRLLPEMIARGGNGQLLHLPADILMPSYTIWHHRDTAVAFNQAVTETNTSGAALLSFQLGPVQEFIAAARTLRDLWSGSMILAWLTFKAIMPVVKKYGPASIIYPSLRGLPFLDLWMLDKEGLDLGEKENLWERIASKSPCLPNKFLAVVPWGVDGKEALDLSRECESAVAEEWKAVSDEVKSEIQKQLKENYPGWDRLWDSQINGYFQVRTSAMPLGGLDANTLPGYFGKSKFDDLYENARLVNEIYNKLDGAQHSQFAGEWQARVELSARLMEASRSIKNIPVDLLPIEGEYTPAKCSQMGSYEQMGPGELEESRAFWELMSNTLSIGGVRLRAGDRLCAVAMIKRFAEPFLRQRLKIGEGVHFPDTATVAASLWLDRNGIDPARQSPWSGQWLHWPKRDFDEADSCPKETWKVIKSAREKEKPPSYYSILVMDADHMGRWLRGENGPSVENVYHEKVIACLKEKLASDHHKLKAKRPLGPAAHMAMSEALTNFSVHVAPGIVEKYRGQLIYAGGDDVLALLPLDNAAQCANALYRAFRGEPGFNNGAARAGYYKVGNREMLMMGHTATLSAGIAVAHYIEDLRFALDSARSAEKMAKNAGRDRVALSVMRRSGEHAGAVMNWDFIDKYINWVNAFKDGASDRWVYHIRRELDVLAGGHLPQEIAKAEIKRHLNRAETETRTRFSKDDHKLAGARMSKCFDDYCAMRNINASHTSADQHKAFAGNLKDFVTLLQSASFFARGRD